MWAVVLAAAAAAGCLGGAEPGGVDAAPTPSPDVPDDAPPPDEGDGAVVDGPALPQRLQLSGCELLYGFFPVDRDAAAARMPEGVVPRPFASTDYAALTVAVIECDDSAIDGEPVGPVRQAVLLLGADAPDEMELDGGSHEFPVAIHLSEPRIADVFRAWSLPAIDGDVVIDAPTEAGDARTMRGRANGGGVAYELSASGAGAAATDVGATRFFGVRDGRVASGVDVSWANAVNAANRGSGVLHATSGLEGLGVLPAPYSTSVGGYRWADMEYNLVAPEAMGVA